MSHVANYSQQSGMFPATATAAVGVIPINKMWTELTFSVSATATETLSLQISNDGGTTFSTNNLGFSSITSPGTVVALAAAATAATYFLRLPACDQVKFTKSGAADSVTVKYTLRWS